MQAPDFQDVYFTQLERRFPSKQAMVAAVAGLLHLSNDAIYRRVRGDSQLTTNELALLADHFGQSLPGVAREVIFQYNRSERTIHRPEDYFDQLSTHLTEVMALDAPRLYLANPGLPFFYEMLAPRLLALKLYVYGTTCWNFAGWEERDFTMDLIDPRLLERARGIAEASLRLPGKELWTLGMLSTTLDQIEYLHVPGKFAEADEAALLLDELSGLVEHLGAMARHGRKYLPGHTPDERSVPFDPVHNELANNDNAILVESSARSTLFVVLITPNFLQTQNAETCALTREWFDRIARASMPLGAGAGKYREWFFNRLQQQIRQTRERILAGRRW